MQVLSFVYFDVFPRVPTVQAKPDTIYFRDYFDAEWILEGGEYLDPPEGYQASKFICAHVYDDFGNNTIHKIRVNSTNPIAGNDSLWMWWNLSAVCKRNFLWQTFENNPDTDVDLGEIPATAFMRYKFRIETWSLTEANLELYLSSWVYTPGFIEVARLFIVGTNRYLRLDVKDANGTWIDTTYETTLNMSQTYTIDFLRYYHASQGNATVWLDDNQILSVTGLNTTDYVSRGLNVGDQNDAYDGPYDTGKYAGIQIDNFFLTDYRVGTSDPSEPTIYLKVEARRDSDETLFNVSHAIGNLDGGWTDNQTIEYAVPYGTNPQLGFKKESGSLTFDHFHKNGSDMAHKGFGPHYWKAPYNPRSENLNKTLNRGLDTSQNKWVRPLGSCFGNTTITARYGVGGGVSYLFSCGFEGLNYTTESDPWTGVEKSGVGSSVAYNSTYKHHGTNSSRAVIPDVASSAYGYAWKEITGQTDMYMRAYISYGSLPDQMPATNNVHWAIAMYHSAGRPSASVYNYYVAAGFYNNSGSTGWHFFYRNQTSNYMVNQTCSVALNTFSCFELHYNVSDTTGCAEFWLNGSLVFSKYGMDTDFSGYSLKHYVVGGYMAPWNHPFTTFTDCVVVNNQSIGEEANRWQMTFAWRDEDDGNVDAKVTWGLYNGSQLLNYIQGEYTLGDGTYTLKTYYHDLLMNQTSLPTATYGNKTTTIYMQMKSHSSVSGGYVCFNNTVSSITVNSQTATNLTYTVSGSSPCWIITDVPENATSVKRNGVSQSGWIYNGTATPKFIHINASTLSTWEYLFGEAESGDNTVALNAPANLSTIKTNNVNFNYTPSFSDPIENSSLWLNFSGTWQRATWNSSAVANASLNTISFNFAGNGSATYIWNVQVYNSTHGIFASSNRTVYMVLEPWYNSVGHNTTTANSPCKFYSQWQDGDGLSGYIFGTNVTGSWSNETWSSLGSNPAWANVTKTLPASSGVRVEYQFWCNDTNNYWNTTGLKYLVTTGAGDNPPTFSNFAYNTTTRTYPCQFTCRIQDDNGLSSYIFSWNGTGGWTNETALAISGTSKWVYDNKTLPSSALIRVEFRWYANDSASQWSASSVQYLITTEIWFYYSWDVDDLDANNVKSRISWTLYNASQPLTYTEGQATLTNGTYTLKTSYRTHLINQTTLQTWVTGNSTVTITLQMKKQLTQSRWIAFNNTIGSITVNSATSSFLNFTVTGAGTFLMVVDVERNCSYVAKDGVNQTGWTYSTTPARHIYMATTLSTWTLSFASSGIEIPEFSVPAIMQFWYEGDLFGFFQSLYANIFGSVDIFYAFLAFLVSFAIYIRTRSLILLTILAFLVLGSGLMLAMPIASGMGVLLMIFGVAGLFHKLYASRYS